MPLEEEEQVFKEELLARFGNDRAFRLRATKKHGQRTVSLVFERERLAIADGRLHELQRQLKFNFTKQRIILSGKLADIEHAVYRLLSSSEIVSPTPLPKIKLPIRRRSIRFAAVPAVH